MKVKKIAYKVFCSLPDPIQDFIRQILKPILGTVITFRVKRKVRAITKIVREKNRINVLFVVFDASIWKMDSVYQLMEEDDFFIPHIFICPRVNLSKEEMHGLLDRTYDFFKNRNYRVTSAYDKRTGQWLELNAAEPDLVFFTTPNGNTLPQYLPEAYEKFLACYYAYYFMATCHTGDDKQIYDKSMFLNAYRVYLPHEYAMQLYIKYSNNKGKNGYAVGFPAVEPIFLEKELKRHSRWKEQERWKKKIIYAPHHSFEETGRNIGNFDVYGQFMRDMAIKYKDETQWSFKPHPGLKYRLYNHPDWGKIKTDKYYSFWENSDNTQLNESDYERLFIESDAIIHDSSSFLVEYLFTRRPCLYLENTNLKDVLNEFGKKAINSYICAKSKNDVETFIVSVIEDKATNPQNDFFEQHLKNYYQEELPSERIIRDLKESLGGRNIDE